MKKNILLLFFLFTCCLVSAQKSEINYLNPADSTKNFYIVFHPDKLPYKGYMFLVQGMFQKAEDLINQTELPIVAAKQGILTIIPVFRTGIGSFGADSVTQNSFLEILNHVKKKYSISDEPFFVGGFSIGGTCAIKYAELAIKNNYAVKPAAIFALDSPLDFERMYKSILREKRLISNGDALDEEGEYILKRFKKDFGGLPGDGKADYNSISPYTFNDTTQRAIKLLVNMPIRLYTEPNVNWWLKTGADYSGMNAFDFAAMTNELSRLGNKKVELRTTENKGYRKPANEYHPHSWSIAEPVELVKWLLEQKN